MPRPKTYLIDGNPEKVLMSKEDQQDLESHDGYTDLANAIIARAYKDLVFALLTGTDISLSKEREGYESLIKWFTEDQWYQELTDVDGTALVRKARQEVKLIKECVNASCPDLLFMDYMLQGKMSFTQTDFKNYLENYRFDRAYKIFERKMREEDFTGDPEFENLAADFEHVVLRHKSLNQTQWLKQRDNDIFNLAKAYTTSKTKVKGHIKMRAKMISWELKPNSWKERYYGEED